MPLLDSNTRHDSSKAKHGYEGLIPLLKDSGVELEGVCYVEHFMLRLDRGFQASHASGFREAQHM